MDNNDELSAVVFELADADPELPDEAALFVLAAMESDEELSGVLDGTGGAPPVRSLASGAAEPAGPPVEAFLRSIEVTGFRGIGPAATLKLHPAPGLTIVAGRNGSGKSSFSEGLEVALTGDSYRWKTKKSALFKDAWRNLHHPVGSQIRVRLAEEGQTKATTVGVDWGDGGDLGDRSVWVQRHGQPREAGPDPLGWGRAMELYRPILSYDELGALLEAGPTTLYEDLARLLGLDQLADAQQRLDAQIKRLGEPATVAKALRTDLNATLTALDDPRATYAVEWLKKRTPDLDAVEQLVTGTAPQPVDVTALRALAELRMPVEADVARVAWELRAAVDAVAASADNAADVAERRAGLLRQALEFHRHRGDGTCPVCGIGMLDEQWRARVGEELAAEDEQAGLLRQARELLRQRRRAALALIGSVPEFTQPGRFELVALADARAARERWTQASPEDAALAEHLTARHGELAAAVTRLREEAGAVLAQNEDAWAPVATRLAEWVGHARRARSREQVIRTAKLASDWLKQNAYRLRNQRLEPLATEARRIWAELREESNVDLGAITLEGQKNRRHVKLAADVDGAEANSALAVMSQGELHALTLALFLPRATRPASPFRFVVLDDPIQAMDPAKIDGFVRVLERLARDRQVIVLTHDDRLPQAVKNLRVPARILDVHRAAGSVVRVDNCEDPAKRYIADAFALVHDEGVPEEAWRRVLPGLCRMAVESAARDAFMARRFAAGADRSEVERDWQDARTTRQKVGLAVPDGPESLDHWASRVSWRGQALWICGSLNHTSLVGDPVKAIEDIKKTVDDLRDGSR